jgi:CBS domain-containing protein
MANSNSTLDNSTLALPVRHLVKRAPLYVEARATVAEAAQAMQAARIGSILVSTAPPGIVTDRDLRGRVLAASLGAETSVRQVMTRPVKTIDANAPTYAALRLMLEENIHHLPVTEEGKIVGVVSATDLLFQQGKSPVYLRGFIESLDDSAKAANYAEEIGQLVSSLFNSSLAAIHTSQIVSSLNDALLRRLVALAIAKLGAAPTQFAWIVFGSEGRLEQTLLTDQDNALIYAEESDSARTYFAALAKQVVGGFIQAGFPPCAGGFMATNWCKPLAQWRELFSQWIRLPKPQALLDAAIFFDFRAVAGNLSLDSLDEIIDSAKSQKLFLSHMARGAMDFYPPLGFFNRLRGTNGKVDLKRSGIAPIVGLARVAALAAGSRERSTLERLKVANNSGALLSQEDATSLSEIYPFFFKLRLQAQLKSLAAKRAIDHSVVLADLSILERRHLREAFVIIKRIQYALVAAWQLQRLA